MAPSLEPVSFLASSYLICGHTLNIVIYHCCTGTIKLPLSGELPSTQQADQPRRQDVQVERRHQGSLRRRRRQPQVRRRRRSQHHRSVPVVTLP